MSEHLENIKKADGLAIDCETQRFDWEFILPHNARIIGLSYAAKNNYDGEVESAYITDKTVILEILSYLKQSKKKFIVYNSAFDILKFCDLLNCKPEDFNFEDGYILTRLCDENLNGGLKDNWDFYIGGKGRSVKYKDVMEDEESLFFAEYAKQDAVKTLELFDRLNSIFPYVRNSDVYTIEHNLIPALIYMNSSGTNFDKDYFIELYYQVEQMIEELEQVVTNLLGDINVRSPKQLTEAFNNLGIYSNFYTEKGAQSWSSNSLAELAEIYPPVASVNDLKQAKNFISKFVEPTFKLLENFDKLYPSYNALKPVTGRTSCSNPPLQQIPARNKFKLFRRCFIPDYGEKFIITDFSQVELRILAHYSKEPALIDAYNNGKDIHIETAKKLFGVTDPTDEQRFIGKSINFMVGYGISGLGLYQKTRAMKLEYTESECDDFIQEYFKLYPNIKNFISAVHSMCYNRYEKYGFAYVNTFFGRTRRFTSRGIGLPISNSILRQAVNAIIQGTAADIAKIAVVKLFNQGYKTKIFVHDEFVISGVYNESDVDNVKKIVEDCTPNEFPVRLTTQPKLADSWAEKG